MADVDRLIQQQQILADFGEFALRNENLDDVLMEACRLASEGLGTGRAKVLEIQDQGQTLFVRAGVGWAENVVGHVRLSMSEHSSETYSIKQRVPTITNDIAEETRFLVPDFMRLAGVRALVNVPILTPGNSPYGLLQVDATEPRNFQDQDIQFLRTYATILGPVIDRLRKVDELSAGFERFNLIVESTLDYAIFLTDAEDKITHWYSGAEAVFGWPAEEIVGQPSEVLYTLEDREHGVAEAEVATARHTGKAPNVRWHLRRDGSRVFIEGVRLAVQLPNGSRGFMKIGQDMTDRRWAEERQHILVAELQHRTRNLLGVIRSISQQTVAGSSNLIEFQAKFSDRLEALGRVQGLLSRSEEMPVTFNALVKLELAALGAEESTADVFIDGPDVAIRKRDVQTLSLAIHELATNARKYGALSGAGGRLAITWRTYVSDEGARRLLIDWLEEGVSLAEAIPAQSGGFGRSLIERALPYALRAKTSYVPSATGIHCSIDLALRDRPHPQGNK